MFRDILIWLRRALDVRRSRRRLGELTDTELRDVGLTPADVRHEAARPFWDYDSYKASQHGRRPRSHAFTSGLRAWEERR